MRCKVCREGCLYLDIQFLHTLLPRRTLGSPSRQPVCGKKKQNTGTWGREGRGGLEKAREWTREGCTGEER